MAKIYKADKEHKADLIACEVDREHKADIKVYMTDRDYKAKWKKSHSLKGKIS